MLSRQAVRNAHKAAARSSAASKTEEVTKLSSGLTVASIDKQGAHSQLVLAFRAGSRYEDKTQGGLVHHMRNHVGRDAKNYFGTSLVWSASEAGGALTAFATRDLFGVSICVPRDNAATALSVLGHVAAAPAFKPWELEEVIPTLRVDNAYRQAYNVLFEDIHRAAYRNGSLARSTFAAKYQIGKYCHNALTKFAEQNLVSGKGVLYGVNIEHDRLAAYGDDHAPIAQGTGNAAENSPYKGGEKRRDTGGSQSYVIVAGEGASGSDVKAMATQAVLLAALGRSSAVQFSGTAGNAAVAKAVGNKGAVSSFQAVHSDGGLAGVYLSADATAIDGIVRAAVKAIKSFQASDIESAKRRAAMDLLRASAHSESNSVDRVGQLLAGVSDGAVLNAIEQVSGSDVEAAAKKIASRLSITSYGNVANVPYLDTL